EIEGRSDEASRLVSGLRERLRASGDDGDAISQAFAPPASLREDPLRRAKEITDRFLSLIRPAAPARFDLAVLAADALVMVRPRLASRRGIVELNAEEGAHFVVGRRRDLLELFVHLLLGVAGVEGDADEVPSERGEIIPRAFGVSVLRLGDHEVVTVSDAGEDGAFARDSLFEAESPSGTRGVDLDVIRR